MTRDAAFHVNAEAELLRQCAASGQLSASQVHAHERAGELPEPSTDRDPPCQVPYQCTHATICAGARERCERARLDTLADLQREIADDAARVLIETRALQVGLVRGPEGDTPLYDVSQLDPFEAGPDELQADLLADVTRAARYLRLRDIAVQPAGCGNLVTFRRA